MSLFKFSFKHSLRNIYHKLGSSLIIVLTMSILMMVMILSIAMHSILSDVFTYEAKSEYQSIDIVMTYDENSSARLINIRELKEKYQDDIVYANAFFAMNTLFSLESNSEYFYAKLVSGTPLALEQVLGETISSLGSHDAIITKSLADKSNIELGDSVSFQTGNGSVILHVVSIIEDKGIFSGDQVFFLKSTFAEEVYDLSSMDNIGNIVYISIVPTISKEGFIETLYADPSYSDYVFTLTIDPFEIDRASTYASVLFFGISVLMFVALLFVLYSLFLLFFKDFQKEQGIVLSLGGNRRYLQIVFMNTFLWFMFFSLCFSAILTFVVLNIGIRIYGIREIFFYPLWSVLFSTLILILVYLVLAWMIDRRFRELSSISMISMLKGNPNTKRRSIYLGILITMLGLILLVHPFSIGLNAIGVTILSILILFQLLDIALLVFRHKKNSSSLFQLISFRNLKENKIVHQSLRVMMIIFIVLISVISVRSFIDREARVVKDQIIVDYMILGIYDYNESMLEELNTYPETSSSSATVFMDSYLYFGENIKRIRYSVSMPFSTFGQFFEFPLEEQNDTIISGSDAYILLPYSLKYIYNIELGDTIQVDFSSEYQGINLKVGGFFYTNFDNLIYTNYFDLNHLSENAIFINSSAELYDDLIGKYSLAYYYVVDMDDFMNDFLDSILRANDLFMFLSGVLIISFIIVLFNNTILVFETEKATYAKLKILGLSKRTLRKMLFKEFLTIVCILVLFTGALSVILTFYYPKMMLVFNYFKEIIPTWIDYLLAFLLMVFILGMTYIYFAKKLNCILLINESKTDL
ncbi:MAG: FtsX-like permease family protein [Candidatus Izemoplasmatales bacterium]